MRNASLFLSSSSTDKDLLPKSKDTLITSWWRTNNKPNRRPADGICTPRGKHPNRPDTRSSCNVNNEIQSTNKTPEITTNQWQSETADVSKWKRNQPTGVALPGHLTRRGNNDSPGHQVAGNTTSLFFSFFGPLSPPNQPTTFFRSFSHRIKSFPPHKKKKKSDKKWRPGRCFKDGRRQFLGKNKTQKPRRINRRPVTFLALQRRINKSPRHTKSYTKIIHSGDGG